jgi:hypothetical protein
LLSLFLLARGQILNTILNPLLNPSTQSNSQTSILDPLLSIVSTVADPLLTTVQTVVEKVCPSCCLEGGLCDVGGLIVSNFHACEDFLMMHRF